MVLVILLTIVFGFLGWLLLSPIQLVLDSDRQMYCLRWMGLGRVGMKVIPGDLVLRYESWLFQYEFHPLSHKKKRDAKKKKRQKKTRHSFRKVMRKIRNILGSFEIKAFWVNLDTDDYILNGYLYPLLFYLGKRGKHLKVNFQGDLDVNIVVENRLYRILRAIIF